MFLPPSVCAFWGGAELTLFLLYRSLSSQNSLRPLEATKASVDILMSYCCVGRELEDILLAFGSKPRNSESGIGVMNFSKNSERWYCKISHLLLSTDSSFDIVQGLSYLFRYPEQDFEHSPWRVRQTGVYHQFSTSPEAQPDLWILIHPKSTSVFMQAVTNVHLNPSIDNESSPQYWNGIDLDSLLFSSYFSNWRWYLKDLSVEYDAIVRKKSSHPV